MMTSLGEVVNNAMELIEEQTAENEPSKRFDISGIDFELLIKEFAKNKKQNLVMKDLEELPECYDEVSISTYRQKIYEYVYTRYKEVA